MSVSAVELAAAMIRAWVRLHTFGLPATERTQRLAEIESDLWEFRQDRRPEGWADALTLLARTAAGSFDDLAWRFERSRASARTVVIRQIAAAGTFLCAAVAPSTPGVSLPTVLAVSLRPPLSALPAMVVSQGPERRPDVTKHFAARHGSSQVGGSPDFSGTWILDPSSSMSPQLESWDPRRIAACGDTVVIAQTLSAFDTHVSNADGPCHQEQFDLGGLVSIGQERGESVIKRSSWSDSSLVTVTTRFSKGGAWSTIDVRRLASDGTTMTVERVTQTGAMWSTYVGREPDSFRSRTRDTFIRADRVSGIHCPMHGCAEKLREDRNP